MNGILSATTRSRRLRLVAFVSLGLAWLLTLGGGRLDAATIKGHVHSFPTNMSHQQKVDLQEFLVGGPAHWAVTRAPQFPSGLSITNPNGTLKNNSLVNFLFWDRQHDPIFFDRHHPRIATLLQSLTKTTRAAQMLQVPATISQPPHSSAFMVLIPPTTDPSAGKGSVTVSATAAGSASASASGSNATAEGLVAPSPVPEPSSVISTLALFGVASGWYRLRSCRTKAAA
jgi:hypothetical protein